MMNDKELSKLVLGRMPHFIAVNYQRVLEAQAAREQVERAVHVYDLGLRTLTIALVSQYLIRDRSRMCDPYLNELLLQKFPHLTVDAWQQLFFTSLRAYEGKRDLFFMPELYDFYWERTAVPHRAWREVEPPFERLTQVAMEIRTERSLPEDEVGWGALAREAKTLLDQILSELVFIGDYDLIRVLECDEPIYDFELHKGLRISRERARLPRQHLECDQFYLRRRAEEFLLLHPLLVFWEEIGEKGLAPTDAAVYDRFVYERLQYLLTTLGRTVLADESTREFIELLYETIEEEKRKRLQAEKITWWQLRDICADITEKRMSTVADKYRPELYLQRDETRQSFERFLESEKRCFVLIGKSGVGKSNFLLAVCPELHKARSDVSVLMYDGAHLDVEPSVSNTVSQDFDNRVILEGRRVEEVWREIAKIDRVEERLVLLCVDAVNENLEAKELLRQLNELVQGPWSWLKVVITSRPETWQEMRREVKLAQGLYYREAEDENLGVELEPFSYSEQMESFSYQELPQAYAKYRRAFDLQTPYEALRGELRKVLQEPLNLWLVASTYVGKEIPERLKISELVERYVKAMLASGGLRERDLRLLEEELVPLMIRKGRYSNALTIADIDAAGGGLYDAVYSEQVLSDGSQVNELFVNLLDAEILVRQEEGREQKIRFKYERFYEYFVGRRLFELAGKAEDRVAFFRDLAIRAMEVPFLWGAVKSALILEARDRGPQTMRELCFSDQQHVKEMLVVALTEFGQGEQERVEGVLGYLLEDASRDPLSRLLKGRLGGEGVLNAKKIAVEVASNLGQVSILAVLATDSLGEVRAHAVRYAYYLWNSDREKGYALLEDVGSRVLNRLGLPNTKALGFCINLSLLIFLDHFAEPEVAERLQGILRSVLKQVLYIDAAPLGLRGLERLGREVVLRAGIRFVTTLTSSAPRYFPANLRELRQFFNLPQEDREMLLNAIDCLDSEIDDIESIDKDIIKLAKTDDPFATFVTIHIVLALGDEHERRLLSVLESVFKGGMERGGTAAVAVAIHSLYWAYLYNEERRQKNDEVLLCLVEFEKEFVHQTKGMTQAKSGKEYFGLVHWASLALSGTCGELSKMPIVEYARSAVEEEDTQFAVDLIWLLGAVAITHRRPHLALAAIVPLLHLESQQVQERLTVCLARIRKHHPYAVDNFFVQHNVDQSIIQRALAAEADEQESVIFHRIQPFMNYEVPNSPYLRREWAKLLRQIVESRSLNEAIREVIKKLIDEVYGENVFA